jgi:hypothetical protein
MQADPRVGIELPLRMLIWQDPDGTHVGYLDPRELADRYALDGHQRRPMSHCSRGGLHPGQGWASADPRQFLPWQGNNSRRATVEGRLRVAHGV